MMHVRTSLRDIHDISAIGDVERNIALVTNQPLLGIGNKLNHIRR